MAVPVTFSPPGTAYEPSIEDALRDGVVLMLRADDITRKAMSFDDEDPDKGVRIFAGFAHTAKQDGRIVVPQIVVTTAVGSGRLTYTPSRGATKLVSLLVVLFEGPESDYIDVNATTPQITPEAKIGRIVEVLMMGTLFKSDQERRTGKVVDMYLSPLLEDGTYDQASIRYLNELLPAIEPRDPQPVSRRTRKGSGDEDSARDIAVLYSLKATYTVAIEDRENMRRGGFNG